MAEGMTQQEIKQAYDCVVIGAGNGGLASAAQLAARGLRVLLLEQHNLPGGFATSFTRGRFEFEVSLHQFADIGPPTNKGSVREFFENDLGVHLDWVELPEAFRLILTDPDEALDVAVKSSIQDVDSTPLVFLMNPTRSEQVIRVADSGEIMPHKSTYFYPKILTGLVLNKLAGEEKIHLIAS